MITQARLKELFDYSDGNLIWIQKGLKRKLNYKAGTTRKDGRVQICVDRKIYLAHRLIWLWHHGCFPKDQIDHIDCNPKNNKIENLRNVNTAQNHWNIGKTKQNKSGVKGVSWSNKEKKYVAQIIANSKHHWIGQFDTLKEAANAYKKAANELHGNYARF